MIPTTDRHELKLIRGGKAPAMLGLPCDSCDRRHDAPGECGDCAFLAVRQRVIEERRKAKSRKPAARRGVVH